MFNRRNLTTVVVMYSLLGTGACAGHAAKDAAEAGPEARSGSDGSTDVTPEPEPEQAPPAAAAGAPAPTDADSGVPPSAGAGAVSAGAGAMGAGAGAVSAGTGAMSAGAAGGAGSGSAGSPASAGSAGAANKVTVAGDENAAPIPCNANTDCIESNDPNTLWRPVCGSGSSTCGPCATQAQEDAMTARVIECLTLMPLQGCAGDCLVRMCHRPCAE